MEKVSGREREQGLVVLQVLLPIPWDGSQDRHLPAPGSALRPFTSRELEAIRNKALNRLKRRR